VSESVSVLKTFLKLVTRNAVEDIFHRGFQSVLGILFKGGLQLALGGIAIMVSYADLITILTASGSKAYRDIQKAKISGTLYNVRTVTAGILVAENPYTTSLKDLPVRLPRKASIPVHDVFDKSPNNDVYSFIKNVSYRQLDSAEVFRSLSNLRGEGERYHCVECSHVITINGNGAQIGHAPYCPKNINKYADWCDECGKDLKKYAHAATCRRAIIENMRNRPKDK